MVGVLSKTLNCFGVASDHQQLAESDDMKESLADIYVALVNHVDARFEASLDAVTYLAEEMSDLLMDIVTYGAITAVVLLTICWYLYQEIKTLKMVNKRQQVLIDRLLQSDKVS